MRAVFGVGSNLGDRWAHLQAAVDGLGAIGRALVVSPVYETAPVGGPADQHAYLNIVVALDAVGSPQQLLDHAHRLEDAAGRVRAERFGPRTLDVDVLLIEGYRSDDPTLTVPHPRMFERAFVLAPLFDIDPAAVDRSWVERLGGEEAITRVARKVGAMLCRAGAVEVET